jgi:hypothetical protein
MEHEMLLCLLLAVHMRTVQLVLWRGAGPDFSERDRALLALLRPHLHQAYLDAERRRNPTPQLTPGSGNEYLPSSRSPSAKLDPATFSISCTSCTSARRSKMWRSSPSLTTRRGKGRDAARSYEVHD